MRTRQRPRAVGHWASPVFVLVVLVFVLGLAACGREAPVYAPGDITVVSTPSGASILINGVDTGEVTPHTFVGLDVNLYNFSVEMTNFVASPGVVPVDLGPLDDITLDFMLFETGLQVTSDPAGAAIFFDGTDTGFVTPAIVPVQNSGTVAVSLQLDCFQMSPASIEVEAIANTLVTVPESDFSLEPVQTPRTVVLEGFANINCGPCPQLAANLVAMADKPAFTPDKVLYLEYSVNWPNPVDPMYLYNAVENTDRFTDYFVLGAPALYANGVQLDDALDAVAMEDAVVAGWDANPGFVIEVTADFSNPAVLVDVTLDPACSVDLTGYSLFVALYEKVIEYPTAPGTNGQSVFHHVFRDRVDQVPALGQLTAGTDEIFNLTLARGDWALDNLAVIAFVQRDSDLFILQAGSFGQTAKTGGNP